MTVGANTLPPDSARAGPQGFLCPFLPSLGQNPRESKERQKAKDSRVGSWQSRGGGAGTWSGEGGRKSPWALGLPQDGGPRQEMEAGGKGEQQSPGRGLRGPGGPGAQPPAPPQRPAAPRDPRPTPCDHPHQPIQQAQEGGPTPESHVEAETNMPLPTPTLGLPSASSSCPGLDF